MPVQRSDCFVTRGVGEGFAFEERLLIGVPEFGFGELIRESGLNGVARLITEAGLEAVNAGGIDIESLGSGSVGSDRQGNVGDGIGDVMGKQGVFPFQGFSGGVGGGELGREKAFGIEVGVGVGDVVANTKTTIEFVDGGSSEGRGDPAER